MNKPTVIGLDLSLTGTGIASSLGWCERVGDPGITGLDLRERIAALRNIRERILDHFTGRPDLVIVEQIAFSRTAGGAAERAWLWFEIVGSFTRRFVPVATATAQQLKLYATGSGKGNKGPVIDAVARRWPQFTTYGDDNLCDAVTLCAMGADYLGHPIAEMPKTHRAALDRIDWPEVA